MKSKLLLALASLVLLPFGVVVAQDREQLETITVVGSRMSYCDLLDTPAVALVKPGDYLLQPIVLYNDTRNEQARRQELHATIRKMIAAAGGRFELVYGENFVGVLGEANYQVEVKDDPKRPDASRLELSLRADIEGNPARGEGLIRDLRAFIAGAERVGRTEIEASGETALSMKRPERYRYALIAAIAKDTDQLRQRMGAGCTVALEGLTSRIEWERVSAAELLLYIPYTMTLDDCGAQPG